MVAAHPDRTCLVSALGDRSMSYQEVDAAASALARRLALRGVASADTAVAILMDRSFEVVIAMLGVLKVRESVWTQLYQSSLGCPTSSLQAGGCYVPLDPEFPANRLSIYVEDSQAAVIITTTPLLGLARSLLPPNAGSVLLIDDDAEEATETVVRQATCLQGANLAYIMFTSGSTGRPKGAMVTHEGLRDLIAFFVDKMALGESFSSLSSSLTPELGMKT